MDVLQFLSALIDAVAWPAVTLVVILLLRPHFGQMLGLIQKVKYKEFEMTFGAATPAAKEELERFWMPDGRKPDAANEMRLRQWMRDNGLRGVSVTTLLNAGPLDGARQRAIADLGLKQVGEGGQGGGAG